tara:strand:+ start:26 stop:478 length:453 start_codon:yes stop_codon:yes gene_type:complete
MNIIKKLIYGKHIKQIKDLNAYVEMLITGNESLRCVLADQKNDFDRTIKKIESSYKPENMSNIDELKLNLSVVNANYLNYIVAHSPITMSESANEEYREKTINLDVKLGVSQTVNCGVEEYCTHELSVALARECGKAVTDKLLKQQGWRI